MIEVYVPHGGPESGPVDDSAHGVLQVGIDEHHYFQGEALGGLIGEEFIRGSTSVNECFESQKSSSTKLCETVLKRKRRTDWNAPPPSSEEEIPEAEWGYAEALTDDIVAFANAHGFRIE